MWVTTAGEVGDDFKGGGSGAMWGPLPTLTTFTPGGPESAVPTEDPLFSGPPIGDPFLMDFLCSRQYSVVRLELERKSCIGISVTGRNCCLSASNPPPQTFILFKLPPYLIIGICSTKINIQTEVEKNDFAHKAATTILHFGSMWVLK